MTIFTDGISRIFLFATELSRFIFVLTQPSSMVVQEYTSRNINDGHCTLIKCITKTVISDHFGRRVKRFWNTSLQPYSQEVFPPFRTGVRLVLITIDTIRTAKGMKKEISSKIK